VEGPGSEAGSGEKLKFLILLIIIISKDVHNRGKGHATNTDIKMLKCYYFYNRLDLRVAGLCCLFASIGSPWSH
jgi:hypothetical protein